MDAKDFFKETDETFTIYVVEQRFAVMRGLEYFKSYKGTPNYIDANEIAQKRIYSVLQWIQKKIPPVAQLVELCFGSFLPVDIVDTITALNKLFGIHEHQAVGPDVIDPIIIQEGKILTKYLNQLIALNKESILRPTIIIILKDNNFERAKQLLANSPNGIHIKFIRNNGETEIFKVINNGVSHVTEFISCFAQQCFNTCSNTKRDILLNEEWAENSIIKTYAPLMLKIRTNLLFDEKTEVKDEISGLLNRMTLDSCDNEYNKKIMKSFKCTLHLFNIFCNDQAGNDLKQAYALACDLNNEILKAHTYRYAYFWNDLPLKEQLNLLEDAYGIFMQNNMADHAIYCRNNALVTQFDSGKVYVREFKRLQEEAISDVPGLVGMSHIFNNTGVAHLVTGQPEESIKYFSKGLDYAHTQERNVQRLALKVNRMIAEFYCGEILSDKELKNVMTQIFDSMVRDNILPFISSRYVLNLFSISIQQDFNLGMELLKLFPIEKLINEGINSNVIGGGQILLQTKYLEQKYEGISLLNSRPSLSTVEPITGIRKDFIQNYGINPFYFCIWL